VSVILASSDGDVCNGVEESPVRCKFHVKSLMKSSIRVSRRVRTPYKVGCNYTAWRMSDL